MQTALTPELPRWQLTGRAERATTCNAEIADELPSVQRNDNAITIVESLRFAAHVARYVQRMTNKGDKDPHRSALAGLTQRIYLLAAARGHRSALRSPAAAPGRLPESHSAGAEALQARVSLEAEKEAARV